MEEVTRLRHDAALHSYALSVLFKDEEKDNLCYKLLKIQRPLVYMYRGKNYNNLREKIKAQIGLHGNLWKEIGLCFISLN